MKRPVISLIIFVMFVLMASQVYAGADITTSGEIRIRCEFDGKSFDKDHEIVHSTLMRTRLGVNAEINDNANAFMQFQDSRRFGEPQSGDVADHGDVYMHQGYITIKQLWENGIGLKMGRFDLNLGNQRVFGSVGWSNVGRVWDGGKFFYSADNIDFAGYWLRPKDMFDTTQNQDFDIFGITSNIKSMNLEVFGFYEMDASEPENTPNLKKLDRITIGLYYFRDHNQFDFTLNGAYQLGKYADTGFTQKADIAAYMVNFEAGYNFEGDMKPRLAVGIDLTSGDDDATDNKNKAYNNLYYTGHKFRGYMDYFVDYQTYGLMDIMVRGKLNPVEGWTVKGDFHLFSSAVERNVAGDKGIGSEFDLTVSTSNISGVKFDAGFSMFMPKEEWAGTDAETPIWFWMMVTAGF